MVLQKWLVRNYEAVYWQELGCPDGAVAMNPFALHHRLQGLYSGRTVALPASYTAQVEDY